MQTNQEQNFRITSGSWGGNGIRLFADADLTTIDYDAAHGEIAGPLKLDENGKFDATGFHIRERGGPIRTDIREARETARYTGRISGDHMTLRVVLTATDTVVGEYQLERGKNVRLHKIL